MSKVDKFKCDICKKEIPSSKTKIVTHVLYNRMMDGNTEVDKYKKIDICLYCVSVLIKKAYGLDDIERGSQFLEDNNVEIEDEIEDSNR